MKTKIILGLGLCLLLTVINLHRAMDNYGITDAKFKVGVLADESASSGGLVYQYINSYRVCIYRGSGEPGREVILFGELTDLVDSDGKWEIEVYDGASHCVEGGYSPCIDFPCRPATDEDVAYND